jgi:hypothetical protein
VGRRKLLYKNLVDLLKTKERMILYDNIDKNIIYDGMPNMGLKKIIYGF